MRIVEIVTTEMPKITEKKRSFTINEIFDDLVEVFEIDTNLFKGHCRKRILSIPRQIYCYVLCKYCTNTLQEIGESIGNRDHSTIINARDEATKYIATEDPTFMVYWNKYINGSKIWLKISS